MRFLDVGDSAVLVETATLADAHRVWAALRAAAIPGVRDAVVGASSVLVTVDPLAGDRQRLAAVAENAAAAGSAREERAVEIPVVYDGEDLHDVSVHTGLSIEDVVRRHSDATYTVAFLGFSPGFAYLVGLDRALRLPRRSTPRTRVPAGSLAIAGEHTAVYPQQTPGGWHLLGHTDVTVFDAGLDRPSLLAPGDRVRFVRR